MGGRSTVSPTDRPAPPAFLTGDARAKWDELVARADWKPGELDTLAAYCAAFGRWIAAERWLAEPGHGPVVTIKDDKGNVRSHTTAPEVAVGERAAREMSRLGALLKLEKRLR